MFNVKHLCIVTYGYPTEKEPFKYTFVDKLVTSFADAGIRCTVIHPIPLIPNSVKNAPSFYRTKVTEKGNEIEIYSPKYPYFYARKLLNTNTGLLTALSFRKAVEKVVKNNNINPDCFYGHFIFPAGYTVAKLGEKYNKPSFFAYGESSPWSIDILGEKKLKKDLASIDGVVAVSTAKKHELARYDLIENSKIEIFPNSIDLNIFYKKSKENMREKYGFLKKDFIIGYTGTFNESKGVMRLVEAVENLKNPRIKLILIGGGKLNPQSESIIHKGKVPHDEVPDLLSACDVFALPTLNEGLSNAIVEAMGCGLPIVSSDKSFNYDVLDETNSILVDPNIITDIEKALNSLFNDNAMRENLAKGSLEKVKLFGIENRAVNIEKWMNRMIIKKELHVNQR